MQKWEYLHISCSLSKNNWLPTYVNGHELPNWQEGPTIHEVSNQLGEQGWELVVLATTPQSDSPDNYRLVFKRPKE